jgi:HEAT repeat protein
MRTTRSICYLAVGVLFSAALLFAAKSSRPNYNGKTVVELIRLASGSSGFPQAGANDAAVRDALTGLRNLGSDAEPVLIDELRAMDRVWHATYEKLRLRMPGAIQSYFAPITPALYRRQTAVTAVGRLPRISAIMERQLIVACKDPDPIVRERAVLILGYKGSRTKPTLAALAEAMAEPELARRLSSRGPLLGGFAFEADTVDGMAADLDRPFSEARYQAAVALGNLGSNAQSAVSALLKACADSNSMVRVASVRALGNIEIGASNSLPVLQTMAGDENSFVRSAAAESIRKLESTSRH